MSLYSNFSKIESLKVPKKEVLITPESLGVLQEVLKASLNTGQLNALSDFGGQPPVIAEKRSIFASSKLIDCTNANKFFPQLNPKVAKNFVSGASVK